MKVFADQLGGQLAKKLPRAVIVAGEEPLQHRDACDAVRQAARGAGIEEREVLDVEPNFAWGRLLETASNLSLFASSKLLELRLGTQKLGQEGAKALAQYAELMEQSDDVLLISMGKLDAKQQKSAWFKALDKHGLFVPVWPVDASRLGYWLRDRAGLHGVQIDLDAARLLGERTEGNLLAADQELQKLALIHPPNTRLNVDSIAVGVEDSARFDVFNLSDACLKGEPQRVSRIVTGLRSEGVEAPIVLWALTRELRTLLSLHQHLDQGQSFEHACKTQKPMIFDKRRPAYQKAISRLPMKRLHKLLLMAQRLDLAVKGASGVPLWPGLHDLAMTMGGAKGILAETPWTYRIGV
ncbi:MULTISPECIES: DNA polymerase III subunit delta [unclassified Halomonas]|uniref:DNA polymerase III subunit delta n=1 Tax=unclassified Halomonas TaxID=2609666 RepID=UPI0021E4C814|nr:MULTISPECIES: DNA polymerase III subunit delta [unclassified Halomonas]UYG01354.1 DNA polymerase III subunit delta [Halomonas sp. GD1P12]WNL37589.1 DNA polymerase III subunit delta [Halomonas sp. PAMB 3232]WNL40903.1 DNA polymerase III subunit delta [Halomonas sp. PAMB 3264]